MYVNRLTATLNNSIIPRDAIYFSNFLIIVGCGVYWTSVTLSLTGGRTVVAMPMV